MAESFTLPLPLQTAVLFLVFNRPETTARVFEAIRRAKPPRLYVAADGPRGDRPAEAEWVAKVREIATAVDWQCEVKTYFQEENLGCKRAVSSGINWFFEQEEQGIILEDDCLPHPDFFTFCENLLGRYAKDDRVSVITGDNFQNGVRRGEASYYFSRYNHVWGWASWRRAWQKADMDIRFWPQWKRSSSFRELWPDSVSRRYWTKIFDRMYRAEIDTWDYAWTASVWYHGGLTATPNVNLVSNIGFGPNSTHTVSSDSPLACRATTAIGEIVHPKTIEPDVAADHYVFDHTFGGRALRFPQSLLHTPRRAAGFACRRLKWSSSQCRN
ncbi:glycosyltransferase family 2 protein [Rhodobacterales bacterium FZCC0069]|nr:glycosyltransferase family 2 protein [Rhodobacterales bacterium FZCC0069]